MSGLACPGSRPEFPLVPSFSWGVYGRRFCLNSARARTTRKLLGSPALPSRDRAWAVRRSSRRRGRGGAPTPSSPRHGNSSNPSRASPQTIHRPAVSEDRIIRQCAVSSAMLTVAIVREIDIRRRLLTHAGRPAASGHRVDPSSPRMSAARRAPRAPAPKSDRYAAPAAPRGAAPRRTPRRSGCGLPLLRR